MSWIRLLMSSLGWQNFFRNFNKLAGMTGTALTELKEFGEIYQLKVSEVPTNRKMARDDNTDVVFRSQSGTASPLLCPEAACQ